MTTLRNSFIVAISAGAMFIGCKQDEAQNSEPAPTAGKATTATTDMEAAKTPQEVDVMARFRQCWAAHNAQDAEVIKSCYDPNAELVMVDYVPPKMAKGQEAALALIEEFWRMYPDIKGEGQLVLVNGSNLAAIVHTVGTNTGPLMDHPATGKSISLFQGQISSLNPQGNVQRDLHWMDQTTIMHQLGLQTNERAPDSETPWAKSIWIVAENSSMEKANRDVAEKLSKLATKGDHEGYFSHVADDISFRYASDKNPMNGIEAYKKGFAMWEEMADYKSEPESLWAAGDWVVAVHDTTATLKKDMEGVPGSKGKNVKTKQLEFMAFADGKLKTHWVFENTAAYAAQLGMAGTK